MAHSHCTRFSMSVLSWPFQSEHLEQNRCNLSRELELFSHDTRVCVTAIGHAAYCIHRRWNLSVFCSHNVSAWWPGAGPLNIIQYSCHTSVLTGCQLYKCTCLVCLWFAQFPYWVSYKQNTCHFLYLGSFTMYYQTEKVKLKRSYMENVKEISHDNCLKH